MVGWVGVGMVGQKEGLFLVRAHTYSHTPFNRQIKDGWGGFGLVERKELPGVMHNKHVQIESISCSGRQLQSNRQLCSSSSSSSSSNVVLTRFEGVGDGSRHNSKSMLSFSVQHNDV